MKTYTQVVHEGEWLGPVDWSFDFFASDIYPGYDAEQRRKLIQRHVDALHEAERLLALGGNVEVLIGASIASWRPLLTVGMYDGWPYWKPYPSLLVEGPLGSERMPWSWLSATRSTTHSDGTRGVHA